MECDDKKASREALLQASYFQARQTSIPPLEARVVLSAEDALVLGHMLMRLGDCSDRFARGVQANFFDGFGPRQTALAISALSRVVTSWSRAVERVAPETHRQGLAENNAELEKAAAGLDETAQLAIEIIDRMDKQEIDRLERNAKVKHDG